MVVVLVVVPLMLSNDYCLKTLLLAHKTHAIVFVARYSIRPLFFFGFSSILMTGGQETPESSRTEKKKKSGSQNKNKKSPLERREINGQLYLNFVTFVRGNKFYYKDGNIF